MKVPPDADDFDLPPTEADSSRTLHAPSSLRTRSAPEGRAAGTATPPAPGTVLGHRYQVVSFLGQGGEGAVVAARDLRADATIALKLIPISQLDHERVARLRRELALARKITDPSVVRTYDLVELPGFWALSMELVEGEPLAAVIAREAPLPLDRLERLLRDVAGALRAAHAVGVTHRDLKPSNALVRADDGRTVITDFGIARAGMSHDADVSQPGSAGVSLTRTGAVVGTPLFMAPEQLEGRAVGPAADVYAAGLILFEAATGELPTSGATLEQLREARRDKQPKLAARRPELPTRFCEIIDRCLEPLPSERYPDGAALVSALEADAPPPKRWRLLAASAAAFLVLAAAAGLAVRSIGGDLKRKAAATSASADPEPVSVAVRGLRRVTFGAGCEEFPSFAPDGRHLVYDAGVGDVYQIMVRDLNDGRDRVLTTAQGWDFGATVAPDGREVAFIRYDGPIAGTYLVPWEAGTPRRLVVGGMKPSFSPDGTAIWAGDRTKPSRILRSTGETTETLTLPSMIKASQVEEVDASRLLVLVSLQAGSGLALFRGEPGSREIEWLYRGELEDTLAVDLVSGVAYVAELLPTFDTQLVAVPIDGKTPAKATARGVTPYKGVALSPGGQSMAWSTCRGSTGLFITDKEGAVRPLQATAAWDDLDAASIPGSDDLVVLSRRSGRKEPWIIDVFGRRQPRSLAVGGDGQSDPEFLSVAATKEAEKVALVDSKGTLWLQERGALRELASGALPHPPAFDGDGRRVFFGVGSMASPRIEVVSTDGGPSAVVAEGAKQPAVSPDGRSLVYLSVESNELTLPMLRRDAGKPEPLVAELEPGIFHAPTFSPDGKQLALSYGNKEVLVVSLETRRVVARRQLESGPVHRVAYAGKEMVFVLPRWEGDIWLAELSRDGAGAR